MKLKHLSIIKKTLKVIRNILSIVVPLSFCAGIVMGLIYDTNDTNDTNVTNVTIGVFIIIAISGAAGFFDGWLLNKNRVDWEHNPPLSYLYSLLCQLSFLHLLLVFIDLLDRLTGQSIGEIADSVILISLCCISFWAYFSVAYGRKHATILTRIVLAFTLLFSGLLLNGLLQTAIKSIKSINEDATDLIISAIVITALIAGCIKGFMITFSRAWREQFTNQSYPFFIIWIAVIIFVLLVYGKIMI